MPASIVVPRRADQRAWRRHNSRSSFTSGPEQHGEPAQPAPLPANGVTLSHADRAPLAAERVVIGAPASSSAIELNARRLPWLPPAARNPFMARNGRSNLHNDAYQTNAYPGPGPSGAKTQAATRLPAAGVRRRSRSTAAARSSSVCVGAVGETFDVFDPHSLQLLATYPLPSEAKGRRRFRRPAAHRPRPSAAAATSTSTTATRPSSRLSTAAIAVLAISDAAQPTITLAQGLRPQRRPSQGESIESALPDWHGTCGSSRPPAPSASRAERHGRADVIQTHHAAARPSNAGQPEKIGNSFAIDESGGVFVVTEEALYRFDAQGDAPQITWRHRYDRGTRTKPGQVNFGSGTTPTLIRSAHEAGGGLVAILDNADPAMHVDVFPRGQPGSHAPVCSRADLHRTMHASSDENNLISLGPLIWAENNYGLPGPIRVTNTTPGMQEVKLGWPARLPSGLGDRRGARPARSSARCPRGSGCSTPTRTRSSRPTALKRGTSPRSTPGPGTGSWSRLAGVGPDYNNFYAPVTIGPDGTLYVGAIGGIVELRGPLAGRKHSPHRTK